MRGPCRCHPTVQICCPPVTSVLHQRQVGRLRQMCCQSFRSLWDCQRWEHLRMWDLHRRQDCLQRLACHQNLQLETAEFVVAAIQSQRVPLKRRCSGQSHQSYQEWVLFEKTNQSHQSCCHRQKWSHPKQLAKKLLWPSHQTQNRRQSLLPEAA